MGNSVTKPQQVILRVLQELQAAAFRTQLVKLVYFVDYIWYQHMRHTLTGLRYMWDLHGPNAISDEIVREADELAKQDLVRIQPHITAYGDLGYLYRADPSAPRPNFDPVAELIIKDVVKKYGRYSVQRIAAASKRTPPFQKTHPGDILQFERPGAIYPDLPEPETANPEEIEEMGEGKSLEEIRQKYGIT